MSRNYFAFPHSYIWTNAFLLQPCIAIRHSPPRTTGKTCPNVWTSISQKEVNIPDSLFLATMVLFQFLSQWLVPCYPHSLLQITNINVCLLFTAWDEWMNVSYILSYAMYQIKSFYIYRGVCNAAKKQRLPLQFEFWYWYYNAPLNQKGCLMFSCTLYIPHGVLIKWVCQI